MKSYTLPAILAASVIALATLFYALFFQGQDPEQAESVLVENSVIAEPTTNTQTSLAPATASEETAPEKTGRIGKEAARSQRCRKEAPKDSSRPKVVRKDEESKAMGAHWMPGSRRPQCATKRAGGRARGRARNSAKRPTRNTPGEERTLTVG